MASKAFPTYAGTTFFGSPNRGITNEVDLMTSSPQTKGFQGNEKTRKCSRCLRLIVICEDRIGQQTAVPKRTLRKNPSGHVLYSEYCGTDGECWRCREAKR